jgi:hypothetical protein
MRGSYFWLDMTRLCTRTNEKLDSHIIENRRAFRRSVPFFENFWREPMSVNVRVVLLVGVRQDYVHVLTKS